VSLPVFRAESDPGPDFLELLRRQGLGGDLAPSPVVSPSVLSAGVVSPGGVSAGPMSSVGGEWSLPGSTPRHGTTILALRFADGVVMAGDRRATEGHLIAHRRIEKVFPADHHSVVAIAGTAGPAMEMVRLFQTQLEHYEKVEGSPLSLEGKANQLAQMVRGHLAWAMQGLVVVPLFAGWDELRRLGRIFAYDVAGGRYEEIDFQATGSGGRDARSALKQGWRADLGEEEAVRLAVRALVAAADEDTATGGPDARRGIYPNVAVVTAEGYRPVADEEVAAEVAAIGAEERSRP